MRRANFLLVGLVVLLMAGCGSKEREAISRSGKANHAINLSVQSDDLKEGNAIEWSFTQTPPEASLSQEDFTPVHTSPQVSFTPPVAGEYRISYVIRDNSGAIQVTQPITVNVAAAPPDTMKQKAAADTEPARAEQPEVQPEPSGETTQTPVPSGETDAIPRIPGKYTVQQSAWKTFSKAETVLNMLRKLGYEPYIQRAVLPSSGDTWYRVRIGTYSSFSAANSTRKKLEQDPDVPDGDIWVDFMRKDM